MPRAALALLACCLSILGGCLSADTSPRPDEGTALTADASGCGTSFPGTQQQDGGRPVAVWIGNEASSAACVRVAFGGQVVVARDVAAPKGTSSPEYARYGMAYWDGTEVLVRAEDVRAGHAVEQRFGLRDENHLVVQVFPDRVQLQMLHDAPAFA